MRARRSRPYGRVQKTVSKRKERANRRRRQTRKRKPQSTVKSRSQPEPDERASHVPLRATVWVCTSCSYREMWEEYFVYASRKGNGEGKFVPWSGRRCFEPRRLLADLGCDERAVDQYWPELDDKRMCNECTIVALYSCENTE